MTLHRDKLRMIGDFLDGDRTEQDYRAVEDQLVCGDEFVQAFVAHLRVEQDLSRMSLDDDMSRFIDSPAHLSSNMKPKTDSVRNSNLHWWRVSVVTVAASLLIATLVAFGLLSQTEVEIANHGNLVEDSVAENSTPQDSVPERPTVVATLGNVKECRWDVEEGHPGYASGFHFAADTAFRLLSGVAQLHFDSGTVCVVQGPCQLVLAENAIALNEGRIAATVPRSAVGFSVTTPSAEVIDLGTEFGVSVDKQGGSQVHVFSGEVVARARNRHGKAIGEPLFVTTQNAIHFLPGTADAKRFEADEAAFVRWVNDQGPPLTELKPPVEGKLLMWLTSDHWFLDDQQCVNVWRDTLSSFNSTPDNALQANPDARPRVIQNAIGGWPAVRFDGIDDCLITTPMASGDSQTIAFVSRLRGSYHDFSQVINYNGPPQRQTEDKSRPGILQIVARLDDNQRIWLRPFAYVGLIGDEYVSVGKIDPDISRSSKDDLPLVGEPFIAVYVYDHKANHAELWINSHSLGSASAPSPIALTSRKVIGRHGGRPFYFCGDVAELMIFDEGLDQSRVEAVSRHLAEKYRIALSN